SSRLSGLLVASQSFALCFYSLAEALAGLSLVLLWIVERKRSPAVALIALPLSIVKTVDVSLMPRVEVSYPGVLDEPHVVTMTDKRIPDMVDHDSVAPAVVDIAVIEGPAAVKIYGDVS